MPSLTCHTLPNGLTVLLREVHSAPVISWWPTAWAAATSRPG